MITTLIHTMFFQRSAAKTALEQDMARWMEIYKLDRAAYSPQENLGWFIRTYPEFRNLFYYRIGNYTNLLSYTLLKLAKVLYKPMETLYLRTPVIGPGLFIQHGFSTIITAQKIGKNCWINQQVTIGYEGEGIPTIGNNVRIAAGAKLFGDIAIGDNAIVGANAVVVKNVPPNCTVVGVPAYIVKREGKRVNEPLI